MAYEWREPELDALNADAWALHCSMQLPPDADRIEFIARIIDPVSFEKVRQHQLPGGPEVPSDAAWRCNRARDKARHIASLFVVPQPF